MRQARTSGSAAVAFAVLMVAGACSDTGNGSGSVATSKATSVAGPSTSTRGASTGDGGPAEGPVLSTSPESRTAVSAPPVDLLVGTAQGLLRLGADGSEDRLIDGPVALAVGDTQGGVVFQTAQGRYADQTATVVWLLPAGAAEPVELLRSRDDQRLSLHEVVVVDGSPMAFYTLHEGSNITDSLDTLRRFDTASGAVTVLGEVGGWEAGSDPVSVGGEIVARQWYLEASSGFAFQDLSGNAIEVPGDPYGPRAEWADHCSDDVRCPGLVEISPDGNRYAYVEGIVGPDGLFDHYRLIVIDTGTGRVLDEIDLPLHGQGTGIPDSLDLDGSFVVVNRSTHAGAKRLPLPSLVVDLDEGDVITLRHAGVARIP